MTSVGSTGFNPYANAFSSGYLNQYAMNGTNEDFLQQAYFPQDNTYAAQNPMFNLAAMQGQPAQDTYQSSGGGALKTGLVGAGAAGGFTFLGLRYTGIGGENYSPVVKDVFKDEILMSAEGTLKDAAKAIEATELAEAEKTAYETCKVGGEVLNAEKKEALKEYIRLTKDGKEIPDAIKNKVPDSIKTKIVSDGDATIAKLEGELKILAGELDAIDTKSIQKAALDKAKAGHLGAQFEEMDKLVKRRNLFNGLAKDADAAKIEELIKNNPKAFGIEATEKAEIEAAAKTEAAKYGTTRKGALDVVKADIKNQQGIIETVRGEVNSRFIGEWDTAANTLKKGAPEELKSAVNSFKFGKAGKAGLIAAAAGLVLGLIFGGKKS